MWRHIRCHAEIRYLSYIKMPKWHSITCILKRWRMQAQSIWWLGYGLDTDIARLDSRQGLEILQCLDWLWSQSSQSNGWRMTFSGGKATGGVNDHSPPPTAEVKMTAPIAVMVCYLIKHRYNFTLRWIYLKIWGLKEKWSWGSPIYKSKTEVK
jgi:hypothetical protein